MTRAVLSALGFLALAGCAHSPGTPVLAPSRITQVNIMTAPVGLNIDGRPGADAFSVKVYANDARNPKTVPIHNGKIEIVMHDGTLYGRTNEPSPLRVWSFDADKLREHQVASSIGAGYDFILRWETNAPRERLITVLARYHSEGGEMIVSPAASVTVMDK